MVRKRRDFNFFVIASDRRESGQPTKSLRAKLDDLQKGSWRLPRQEARNDGLEIAALLLSSR